MLRSLAGVPERTLVSPVGTQTLGNKKAAGGTVQASLKDPASEGLRGVTLRRAVSLTRRWQMEDKVKLWRGVCSPRMSLGRSSLGVS